MNFLSKLKNQANALQVQQMGAQHDVLSNTQYCEVACKMALTYLQDMCAHLNVIQPPAVGAYSLDGKTPFPSLVMRNMRCDARRKMLRDIEVFDYIGVGWDLRPVVGEKVLHTVTVNFPPDLERVEQRLSIGRIQHERKERRHPETNKLQAFVFECEPRSRGFIGMTPDHDRGVIVFRITNVGGFCLLNTTYPATKVTSALMDELAKKIVGDISRFA